MADQASKLREMVIKDPAECKHGRVLLDGSKCLFCKHEDELAVKDAKIAELEAEVIRMDDALSDSLKINEKCKKLFLAQVDIMVRKIKSMEAKERNNK